MVRTAFASFLLAIGSLSPAFAQADPDIDGLEKRAQSAPQEVAGFINRSIECWHWKGEDGYDAKRRQLIAQNIKRLRCDALDKDEAGLKTRHPSPDIVKLLDDARTSLR